MWTTASIHANALRLPPCFGCSELGSPPFAEPRRRNRQLNMPVLVAAMLRLDHYPRGGVRILVSQAGNRCRILRCIQVAACDYCRPFIDLVHCESRQRTPRGHQKAPLDRGSHGGRRAECSGASWDRSLEPYRVRGPTGKKSTSADQFLPRARKMPMNGWFSGTLSSAATAGPSSEVVMKPARPSSRR